MVLNNDLIKFSNVKFYYYYFYIRFKCNIRTITYPTDIKIYKNKGNEYFAETMLLKYTVSRIRKVSRMRSVFVYSSTYVLVSCALFQKRPYYGCKISHSYSKFYIPVLPLIYSALPVYPAPFILSWVLQGTSTNSCQGF